MIVLQKQKDCLKSIHTDFYHFYFIELFVLYFMLVDNIFYNLLLLLYKT